MIDIISTYKFVSTYIFPNVIVLGAAGLTGTYIKGAIENRFMRRRKKDLEFDELTVKGSVSLNLFHGVNKGLDWAYNAVTRHTYKHIYDFVDSVVPDRVVSRIVERIYGHRSGLISGKFAERLKRAQLDFDPKDDAFMFHTKRSIDNRQVSNIISGRYFNGKPVADYLPMFLSEKTFNGSLKAGFVAFLISFGLLSVAYKPQWMFGFLSDRAYITSINRTVNAIQADPSTHLKVEDATAIANGMVANSTGYNNAFFRIFTNGILTSLILSLGIGLIFHRKVLVNARRKMNIPFIADSVEEFLYPSRSYLIRSYKFSLAGSNMRTSGWDAHSPLISIMSSTGMFEAKGVVGAYREGQTIYQSTLDLAQNMLVLGGTGEGKSRQVIMPFVAEILRIKSQHVEDEKNFQQYMDLRTGHVTSKVNLEKYEPLPEPRIAVSMTLMDAKSALWKDVKKVASKFYLEKEFMVIGAGPGELAIDPLHNVTPTKFVAYLTSMASQFGGDVSADFWKQSSLKIIKNFFDIPYLFSRTIEAAAFLEKFHIKPMSLYFIFKLIVTDNDKNSELLAHCIYSIHKCMVETPERLADIVTEEQLDSIEYLVQAWPNEPAETRGGFEANIRTLLNGLNDAKLMPLLTGVSENTVEIQELWKHLVGFNLSMNEYGIPGKFMSLFYKTLIMEEGSARQQRFAQRVEDIGNYFLENFPESARIESSIETIRLDVISVENQEILEAYMEKCTGLSELSTTLWKRGTYKTHLLDVASNQPSSPTDEHDVFAAEQILLAKEALELDAVFRKNQPRIVEAAINLAKLDPVIFEPKENDTSEVKAKKREAMAMFYEYVEHQNRIEREHMFFIGDEYQEFVTIDKTGAAFSDLNFWNQSRSTNTHGMIATQTLNALETRVEKVIMNNLKDQFRTQIILPTDDKETIDHVVNSAGEVSFNKNAQFKQKLKIDGKPSDYEIYNSFNAKIANTASINRHRKANGVTAPTGSDVTYGFDHDIFAEVETIDIDVGELRTFNPFSHAADDIDMAEVPSFKENFLNVTTLPKYQQTGSNDTELRDNLEDIAAKHKAARDAQEADYNKYMTENIVVNAKVYDSSDYKTGGNLQAFAIIKRGNISRVEQVNIAQESDYMDTNNSN